MIAEISDDLVQGGGVGNVLQLSGPRFFEGKLGIALDRVEELLGRHDRTRLGHTFDPRGDVDAVTQRILSVNDDVRQMEADTQLRAFKSPVAVASQATLYVEARLDGRYRAREFRRETVAGPGKYPTAISRILALR